MRTQTSRLVSCRPVILMEVCWGSFIYRVTELYKARSDCLIASVWSLYQCRIEKKKSTRCCTCFLVIKRHWFESGFHPMGDRARFEDHAQVICAGR